VTYDARGLEDLVAGGKRTSGVRRAVIIGAEMDGEDCHGQPRGQKQGSEDSASSHQRIP
jgi:hypothetical protein